MAESSTVFQFVAILDALGAHPKLHKIQKANYVQNVGYISAKSMYAFFDFQAFMNLEFLIRAE